VTPARFGEIQRAVVDEGVDAWLFCDFRGSDPIGRRILERGDALSTRRWFYCLPACGEPTALVSAVEPRVLEDLPGTRHVYRTWQELHAMLQRILAGYDRVAMQYSPRNMVPYVARVDAGTVELVRECGVEVVSAADLIQRLEAVWTARDYAAHCRAAACVRATVAAAFREIGRRLRAQQPCNEADIQRFIEQRFAADGLIANHPPIVAVGAHSADPHYQPPAEGSATIAGDQLVLIDLWAKEPDGVYADITWTGYTGAVVPERYAKVFAVVRAARDAGVTAVRDGLQRGGVRGCDVDAAVRAIIAAAGYAEYFVHRTGHSIGTEVHGNGANIDGFETPDIRRLLHATCFSIEPGIYLPGEFGIRSELDVYIDDDGEAVVTGQPIQNAIVPILGEWDP
jgi:Xaa-Pro aminopeptidase